jgi:sulfur relay (sulfurtransferase) DsrF/TusC family protein
MLELPANIIASEGYDLATSSCSNFSISLSQAFTSGSSLYFPSDAHDARNAESIISISIRLMSYNLFFIKVGVYLLKNHKDPLIMAKVLFLTMTLYLIFEKKSYVCIDNLNQILIQNSNVKKQIVPDQAAWPADGRIEG